MLRLLDSVNAKKNSPSKMSIELAFLRIMTSSRSLGCCRSVANHIQNRGLPGMPSPNVFVYRWLRVRNVSQGTERSVSVRMPRWDIVPSKVSTSDDACDDHSDSVVSTIVHVHVYELCLTQSLGL